MNYSSQSMNRVVEPRSHFSGIANLLILTVVFFLIFQHGMSAQASEDVPSTAWKDGRFHVDVAGVVRRSDIVLARPNMEAGEAMPLGNGRLGVAVWSADGLTAQLNRADTLPDRLSPGQVVIPGLAALTQGTDYSGRLILYDGEFKVQGGGIKATELIARSHGKHLQFFCSTLTPYQGANYWAPEGEAAREQINAFIRGGNSGCDAVIDQDFATHDPQRPARYLPAYDAGDHLHRNDAGMQAIANTIKLDLFSTSLKAGVVFKGSSAAENSFLAED